MSRKTSHMWNFFTIVESEKQLAKCDICKISLSYKSSVSNLKRHLMLKHPTVKVLSGGVTKNNLEAVNTIAACDSVALNDLEAPGTSHKMNLNQEQITPTIESPRLVSNIPITGKKYQSTISTFLPKKISASAKKKIDGELMKLFYCDYQPFKVVEDKGFQKFVKALNPSYELPNRQLISRSYVPKLYEQCLLHCKELVKNASQVSLTTDCWTSINNESFMAVTIHFIDDNFKYQSVLLSCAIFADSHTSNNLSTELLRITTEWGLDKKIILATSDNAANIKSAIVNVLHWKYFPCFAHTLNLIVQDTLNLISIKHVTDKVKTVVSHFKRSSKATSKLIQFQTNSGVKSPKKLLQHVVTRWNSMYYMIQRFIELEEAVRTTVAMLNIDLPQLTVDEWAMLKSLIKILEPFENATRAVSGQQYMSASLVIVINGGLLDICEKILNCDLTTPVLKTVIKKLESGLKERVGNVEYNTTIAMCTFLDPRFKSYAFKNKDAVEHVKKNVITALNDIIKAKDNEKKKSIHTVNKDEDAEVAEQTETFQIAEPKLSLWSSIDSIVSRQNSNISCKNASSRASIEMQRKCNNYYF